MTTQFQLIIIIITIIIIIYYCLRADNKFSILFLYSSTGLFISVANSSHASCFFYFVKVLLTLWVPLYCFFLAWIDTLYDSFLSPLHFENTLIEAAHQHSYAPLLAWMGGRGTQSSVRHTVHVHTGSCRNLRVTPMRLPVNQHRTEQSRSAKP